MLNFKLELRKKEYQVLKTVLKNWPSTEINEVLKQLEEQEEMKNGMRTKIRKQ